MAYGVVGGGVVGDLREVNARSLARVQGALARPGERRGGIAALENREQ